MQPLTSSSACAGAAGDPLFKGCFYLKQDLRLLSLTERGGGSEEKGGLHREVGEITVNYFLFLKVQQY